MLLRIEKDEYLKCLQMTQQSFVEELSTFFRELPAFVSWLEPELFKLSQYCRSETFSPDDILPSNSVFFLREGIVDIVQVDDDAYREDGASGGRMAHRGGSTPGRSSSSLDSTRPIRIVYRFSAGSVTGYEMQGVPATPPR